MRMITAPRKIGRMYVARCVIYEREYDLQYDMIILSTILKGIYADFKKARLPIDDSLKCIVGRVFTIAGREWPGAPKELFKIDDLTRRTVAPKVYRIDLRPDLEAL